MSALRRLLAHRRLAALIVAAALLMKLLVPTGFMIAEDHGRITVTLCSGVAPRTVEIAVPGLHGDGAGHAMAGHHGKSKDHGKAEMPCAFSGLSAQALGAADPILLVALVAFIVAAGRPALPPAPSRSARLRPPLRGPPAHA